MKYINRSRQYRFMVLYVIPFFTCFFNPRLFKNFLFDFAPSQTKTTTYILTCQFKNCIDSNICSIYTTFKLISSKRRTASHVIQYREFAVAPVCMYMYVCVMFVCIIFNNTELKQYAM